MSRNARQVSVGHAAVRIRPLFRLGDTVAVRSGVADPDFEGVRLDGWTGTIIDADLRTSQKRYLVQWSRRALESLPADCRDRCEAEDMAFDRMWLFEDELEKLAGARQARQRDAHLLTAHC